MWDRRKKANMVLLQRHQQSVDLLFVRASPGVASSVCLHCVQASTFDLQNALCEAALLHGQQKHMHAYNCTVGM